jgi:saccharopine dehydrogenase-like NADP-dependent oxidoreductase
MKVLVLGGSGLQGKAVIHDLSNSPSVNEILCADLNFDSILGLKNFLDMSKIKMLTLDVNDTSALISAMQDQVDVVIDVLPVAFMKQVVEAALEAQVNVVNTMYGYTLPEDVIEKVFAKEIVVMPECGLDPGIDLILCGHGVSQLDEVLELHSYCGGIPEEEAIDNPLKYKITWTWHGVLLSYKRPARIMRDGKIIDIPAEDQHAEKWIEVIDFPGLGQLELIPNGDAVVFAEYLGISKTLRSTSRCSMRWQGHSEFWKNLIDLNFLSDEPVKGFPFEISPHEFMVKHLEPQLQYKDGERDIVAMRNIIIGKSGGEMKKITYDMVDRRDLETGLFAMNRTVGYTASIVAQMIANGDIEQKGLLTPIRDIPCDKFLNEIKKRGIVITESVEGIEG